MLEHQSGGLLKAYEKERDGWISLDFVTKNIIVSDEALHCGGGRGVKPFFC